MCNLVSILVPQESVASISEDDALQIGLDATGTIFATEIND